MIIGVMNRPVEFRQYRIANGALNQSSFDCSMTVELAERLKKVVRLRPLPLDFRKRSR